MIGYNCFQRAPKGPFCPRSTGPDNLRDGSLINIINNGHDSPTIELGELKFSISGNLIPNTIVLRGCPVVTVLVSGM